MSGGLAGGIVGAIVNDRLARARDDSARQFARAIGRESRKGDFLGFMRGWRVEVWRDNPRATAEQFTKRASLFETEVAKIASDYDRVTLEELVKRITSMPASQVERISGEGQMIGRDELLGRMNALIDFVDAPAN